VLALAPSLTRIAEAGLTGGAFVDDATPAGVERDVADTDADPDDELLIGFNAGVSDTDAEDTYQPIGGATLEKLSELRIHRVRVAPGARESVEQALMRRPGVRFVERNARFGPASVLNDPLFLQQWHLVKISALLAWDVVAGAAGVTIAIVDSGVDGSHPDLAPRMVAGYNFYSGNTNTNDVTAHGTQVAGAAAAAGNNLLGGAGVAYQARIMPIRVTDSTGYASASTLASGITWAADHGARVINISMNGIAGSPTVTSAAQYARSRGALVVAAAGNCGCLDNTPENPYVVSVSGTTESDTLASTSSRGPYVDLSAPSTSIPTTYPGGGYNAPSGTSFATAVVSGVAALVMAANPALAPGQVETLLEANADNLGASGWDQSYGWGRVNALRAVLAAVASLPTDVLPPTASISTPAANAVVSGTVSVGVSASDNVGVARVDLYVDGVLQASDTLAPYTFAWNTTALANGFHTLTAKAVDAAGNVGTSATRTVDVENINTTPPTITSTSPLPGGTVAAAYSTTLQATGGATPYTWSKVSGTLPPGLSLSGAGLLAGTSTGAGTYTFRVRATSAASAIGEKDMSLTIAAAPSAEIIVDNAAAGVQDAAGGRTYTGKWCTSATAGYYGADSIYSCGSGLDTYRWTPTIPVAKSYDVYVRWTANGNRGMAVPITVSYIGGSTTRTFNEQATGGQWVLHGRYSFGAGTSGYVETTDANGGQTSADAIRFVPVP
jgi:subtilisin family serine protease